MKAPFLKAVDEARIWFDPTSTHSKDEKRRARRRFDYALSKITLDDGATPNPIEMIQLHMTAVTLAEKTTS